MGASSLPRNDIRQYDDLVDQWWQPHGKFAMLHWIATARAGLIPPARSPEQVLVDLACGGGLMAPHARRLGYRHIGVDRNRSAAVVAQRADVFAIVGDVYALPIGDAIADVVTAGEILEHVADPSAVVIEAIRILRPGGLLVIDTIANTRRARLLAVEIAERIPGLAPRGIHDPALFVDRTELQRTSAAHGVSLELQGVRLDIGSAIGWLLRRRDRAHLVPTRSSAVLFQAWGRKIET